VEEKVYAVYEEDTKGNIVRLIYVTDSAEDLVNAIVEKKKKGEL